MGGQAGVVRQLQVGGVTGGGGVRHQDTPALQQGEDPLHLRLVYVDVLKQHNRETCV